MAKMGRSGHKQLSVNDFIPLFPAIVGKGFNVVDGPADLVSNHGTSFKLLFSRVIEMINEGTLLANVEIRCHI